MRIPAVVSLAIILTLTLACGSRVAARDREGERPGTPRLRNAEAVQEYTYRTVDGIDLKGDLYMPADADAEPPVVVLIHGGAWRSGDKRGMAAYALEFVKRGYACFAINYRLTPKGRFPNNVNDCKAAVQWLREYARRLGIDGGRIAAAGGSAGGHLSAFIGATGDDEGFNAAEYAASGEINAVIAFYGVFDFKELVDTTRDDWPYLELRDEGVSLRDHLAMISPISYVTPDDPPVFLIHGIEDSLVPYEQSEIYHDALQKVGVPTELLLVENAEHGLVPVKGKGMNPSWDEAINEAIDWLDGIMMK